MEDQILEKNYKKPVFVGLFLLFILFLTLSAFSQVVLQSESFFEPAAAPGPTMFMGDSLPL